VKRIVSGGKGTAAGKIRASKAADIAVAGTPVTIADTLIARIRNTFVLSQIARSNETQA